MSNCYPEGCIRVVLDRRWLLPRDVSVRLQSFSFLIRYRHPDRFRHVIAPRIAGERGDNARGRRTLAENNIAIGSRLAHKVDATGATGLRNHARALTRFAPGSATNQRDPVPRVTYRKHRATIGKDFPACFQLVADNGDSTHHVLFLILQETRKCFRRQQPTKTDVSHTPMTQRPALVAIG
jgi:hypothetical protein